MDKNEVKEPCTCDKTCEPCMCAERVPTLKERVELELDDLKNKILRLSAFLYGRTIMDRDVSTDMIRLMEDQLKVMQAYAAILQNRLAIWDLKPTKGFCHPYTH